MQVMEDAKMEVSGNYHTSDLYLAAYLLSMGLELLDVDHRDRRHCKFVFADRQDRSELVHSFMVGRATANPLMPILQAVDALPYTPERPVKAEDENDLELSLTGIPLELLPLPTVHVVFSSGLVNIPLVGLPASSLTKLTQCM